MDSWVAAKCVLWGHTDLNFWPPTLNKCWGNCIYINSRDKPNTLCLLPRQWPVRKHNEHKVLSEAFASGKPPNERFQASWVKLCRAVEMWHYCLSLGASVAYASYKYTENSVMSWARVTHKYFMIKLPCAEQGKKHRLLNTTLEGYESRYWLAVTKNEWKVSMSPCV